MVCTNLGHSSLSLESPANPIIDTLWFPPVFLDALVAVRLVTPGRRLVDGTALDGVYALEACRAFLDNFNGGRHGAL